ncbi:MAG: hypothetical protein U0263_29365 [Polyangiaceae bacterium]
MSPRFLIALSLPALLGGCSGKQARPAGPPPEDERPRVMAWDSGAPHDPLDDVKGEEVTDDEPDDAGPTLTPADAAAADAGPG